MKKLIIATLVLCSFSLTARAQEFSDNAIGLRLGGNDGLGASVSYQRKVNYDNRLEFNLGYRSSDNFNVFKLIVLYEWVKLLDGNFNWYYGAGTGLTSFDIDEPVNDNETSILATGNIGIEYHFDIPLLISLDVRPEIGTGSFNDDLDFDIALSFRYKF